MAGKLFKVVNVAAAGPGARKAARMSSRARTFPPLLAEALARHRRQIALPSPGMPARRDQRQEPAGQFSGQAVEPGPREHERPDLRPHALAERNEAARPHLAAPDDPLAAHANTHPANTRPPTAYTGT